MQSRPNVAHLAHTKKRHIAARPLLNALRLSSAVCVALLALALPLITVQTAGAAGRPPGGRLNDPTVREVDVAEPSVVRIALLFNVRITLTLCGQNYTLPSSGSYETGGLGSGAFISANGDILTADHMVAANGADVVADPDADSDIANLLDNNPSCHLQTPIGPSDIANGFLDAAGINYTTHVSNVRHMVWQDTPYSGQLDTTSSQSYLGALKNVPELNGTVLAESSPTQDDLAILHVNLTDTPSIRLDDSSQVAVEDQLTIIGFPGNADAYRAVSDQSVDANDLLTPSVNNVTVSAIKANSDDTRLIQVSGNVEHGDSGGPALDANGNIVGIVSFGTSDGSAETVGSTSFLRSSNDVQPLIANAGVSTAPGNFEKQWEQAFNDYAATAPGHWHKAARELDALANSHPDFKGAQPYKDYADKAAAVEQLPVDDSGIILIISIFVALALLAAIVLTVMLLRQRRSARLAAALAPASQGLPFGAYGPPSQFGMYGPPSRYGGYAPPSQYRAPGALGAPGAPSQYAGYPVPTPYNPLVAPPLSGSGPTVPYTNPAALPATPAAPVRPAASIATELLDGPDGASDAPMGRMTFPQVSNPGYGAASDGNGGYNGSASGGSKRPASPSFGSYGWPASGPQFQQSGSGPAAERERGICMNGHSMPPGEVYCAMCGAPRTPTISSQPGR